MNFNRLKLDLWISLLLFLFPLEYVDLKQYPNWFIGLSSRLKVTVIEMSAAVLKPVL